jgi:hypothetical protein
MIPREDLTPPPLRLWGGVSEWMKPDTIPRTFFILFHLHHPKASSKAVFPALSRSEKGKGLVPFDNWRL